MKYVEFKDIGNNRLTIDPKKVDFVREYAQKSEGGVDVEITVLIQIGEVSIPVSDTYEDVLKKLGIS